ncbi:MAG: FAD-binding protein, partial [Inquilinus sp.]|nr:FAD-binding protein [Inquilinus sp.]
MTTKRRKDTAPASIDAEVVVVGGGAAGLTLAAALGTAGVETVVVDREPVAARAAPGEGDRTTALTYGSVKVLQGIGAWDGMADEAAAVLSLHIADNWSPLVLQVEPADIGDHPYGYNVDNGAIRAALLDRIDALPSVRHLAPAQVVGFDRDGARIVASTADGTALRGQLLVGADGRESPTRAWSGIPVRRWQYDQVAIVCTLRHERPHQGVAVEHVMPSGPFALVPMPDLPDGDHRSAIIWCERRADAPAYLALPREAFEDELQRRCGDRLGRVRQVGRRFNYPLSGLHARRYVGDRLALMGEAAHAIHPIAAQGLNLSMRDAAALAEVVADARRLGLDIG